MVAVFPVPPFWFATAMVLQGMAHAPPSAVARIGRPGGSRAICDGRAFRENTGSALEISGFLEEPRREEDFPSFRDHGSELGISRPRISRVSRAPASLAAWEARALPFGDARVLLNYTLLIFVGPD